MVGGGSRTKNFTPEEESLLMDLVAEHRRALVGQKGESATVHLRKWFWKKIEQEYNTAGSGSDVYRTSKILKTKYENIKKLISKRKKLNNSISCSESSSLWTVQNEERERHQFKDEQNESEMSFPTDQELSEEETQVKDVLAAVGEDIIETDVNNAYVNNNGRTDRRNAKTSGASRSKNFTQTEADSLVKLVEENKRAIKSPKTDGENVPLKKWFWDKIEKEFNPRYATSGEYRTAQVLKTKYDNLKKQARKRNQDVSEIHCSNSESSFSHWTSPNDKSSIYKEDQNESEISFPSDDESLADADADASADERPMKDTLRDAEVTGATETNSTHSSEVRLKQIKIKLEMEYLEKEHKRRMSFMLERHELQKKQMIEKHLLELKILQKKLLMP